MDDTSAHIALQDTLDAAREARNFVAATLFGWGRRPAIPLVQIVVSELVANAVIYASGGPIAVDLKLEGDRLHLAVTDTAPNSTPKVNVGALGTERGHGLNIVETLSITWGHVCNGAAKVVWADLDLNHPI
jgi:anti-sigma regulatory factor (Ser/Thr protein kinase)